jgi:diguanylate cyclase (GGDEF)-like protein
VKTQLTQGDRRFLDAATYGEAQAWTNQQRAEADRVASETSAALIALADRPPYWQTREFIAFAAALAVISIGGGLIGVWRVSTATRKLEDLAGEARREADRMSERAEHLSLLISLGRRLSSDAEPGTVAASLVAETRQLLSPESASLALMREGRLVPVAAEGSLVPASVALREGVAGRAAETGVPVRVVVQSDAMFPDAVGPLSLLAVPLVHDGRVAGVLVAASPGSQQFDQDDEVVLGLVAMMGAGALRVAERYGSTLALAMHDPLTGLGNRRRLDHDLAALSSAPSTAPVSFLMIDIDHFKAFNDRFGHPAGDELLRSVGGAIAGALRREDVAYRFGGEEFSVLLAETEIHTAAAAAERVRSAVSDLVSPAGIHQVTVSIGVSAVHGIVSPAELVGSADRALYEAKRSGRDRVVVAGRDVTLTLAG